MSAGRGEQLVTQSKYGYFNLMQEQNRWFISAKRHAVNGTRCDSVAFPML
jgi:hypothetical protein